MRRVYVVGVIRKGERILRVVKKEHKPREDTKEASSPPGCGPFTAPA